MTTVVQSDGVTKLSMGPDPSDPTLCMYRLNGQRSIELFSVWRVSSTEPPGEIADMRTALATVLGGPTGTTATVHQERAVNEYFLGDPGFVPKTGWRFTFRNAGTESISIAGKPYETVKLSVTGQGEFRNLYSSTGYLWLEQTTGMPLKFDYHSTNPLFLVSPRP